MREHISHQIIENEGKPIFVVVPYSEYVQLIKQHDRDTTIPQEVVEAYVLKGKSLIAAWREYKKITQIQMAEKLGISQPAYSQMERKDANLKKSTLENIAKAMDISVLQLYFD
jgi:DNA-binding XRE family transcriptional regulator